MEQLNGRNTAWVNVVEERQYEIPVAPRRGGVMGWLSRKIGGIFNRGQAAQQNQLGFAPPRGFAGREVVQNPAFGMEGGRGRPGFTPEDFEEGPQLEEYATIGSREYAQLNDPQYEEPRFVQHAAGLNGDYEVPGGDLEYQEPLYPSNNASLVGGTIYRGFLPLEQREYVAPVPVGEGLYDENLLVPAQQQLNIDGQLYDVLPRSRGREVEEYAVVTPETEGGMDNPADFELSVDAQPHRNVVHVQDREEFSEQPPLNAFAPQERDIDFARGDHEYDLASSRGFNHPTLRPGPGNAEYLQVLDEGRDSGVTDLSASRASQGTSSSGNAHSPSIATGNNNVSAASAIRLRDEENV